MANAVAVMVRDVIGQMIDEVSRRITCHDLLLEFVIFRPEANLFRVVDKDAVLCERRPTHIPPGVTDEVFL